jgi:hypothetical protein
MSCKREYHNPMELIKQWWPDADVSHITYDPEMRDKDRDYWRMEQSGGDGTLLFTIQMLQSALLPLLNKSTYFKRNEPDWSKVKDIRYTIGKMRHVTVFGMVWLRCSTTSKYPGQKERVRIPVKCEYVIQEEENNA